MKVRVFGIIVVASFFVCVSFSLCAAQKVPPPGIFNWGTLNEGEEEELKKPNPPPPTPVEDLGKPQPPVLDTKPRPDTIGPAPQNASPVDTGKDRPKR